MNTPAAYRFARFIKEAIDDADDHAFENGNLHGYEARFEGYLVRAVEAYMSREWPNEPAPLIAIDFGYGFTTTAIYPRVYWDGNFVEFQTTYTSGDGARRIFNRERQAEG